MGRAQMDMKLIIHKILLTIVQLLIALEGFAMALLIPMDARQNNHLKAYGIAYFCLTQEVDVDWLINYRGGSFLIPYTTRIGNEVNIRGITHELISDAEAVRLKDEISSPDVNMNVVKLEKVTRIAVYSPKNELIEDESDAVLAVLEYAEIPFDIIYDDEVLSGALDDYDWLHLHHEDFTGQVYRHMFREEAYFEAEEQILTAAVLGYDNVPEMKADVVNTVRLFCASGKYLFAMCSGAETLDIALAADGAPLSNDQYSNFRFDAQGKLDFSKSFAFQDFTLEWDWRFSDINENTIRFRNAREDYFTLFDYSAKWDIVPCMLNQNHQRVIREFFGLTSAFNKQVVKSSVYILGENSRMNRVRYVYGTYGEGHWTYYSGHDPERPPGRERPRRPAVELHPNSPGYRLILNNVLFPAARKKKQKT